MPCQSGWHTLMMDGLIACSCSRDAAGHTRVTMPSSDGGAKDSGPVRMSGSPPPPWLGGRREGVSPLDDPSVLNSHTASPHSVMSPPATAIGVVTSGPPRLPTRAGALGRSIPCWARGWATGSLWRPCGVPPWPREGHKPVNHESTNQRPHNGAQAMQRCRQGGERMAHAVPGRAPRTVACRIQLRPRGAAAET
jgi:hypothetical protein